MKGVWTGCIPGSALCSLQVWICSLWLLQEDQRAWTQTVALHRDVPGVQEGETRSPQASEASHLTETLTEGLLPCVVVQGIHNVDVDCFNKYGKVWG